MSHPDPAFPVLHGRPAAGWVNDPNGLAYIDETFHVFFQHNPDGPVSAKIRWGHASSDDLISWRVEPIALSPRPGAPDQAGCWTGCVTDDAGVPTAVYSGVADFSGHSDVLLARSDRTLREWTQDTEPTLPMPEDPAISDARDPYIFTFEGRRYAIQGAGHPEGRSQILLYACDDLTKWQPLGALLTGDDPVAADWAAANIWECPNLVRIGERWVLITSVMGAVLEGDDRNRVRYLVGDLRHRGGGLTFVPTQGGLLDTGRSFYAPQVLSLPDRTLMWSWSWENGRSDEQIAAAGWAGCLTYPRDLILEGERLISRPAPELAGLRQGSLPLGEAFDARSFEVFAEGQVSVVLLAGDAETVGAELPAGGRVFVDGSLVESFAVGELAATSRTYPEAGSRWVVRADAAEIWELGLG